MMRILKLAAWFIPVLGFACEDSSSTIQAQTKVAVSDGYQLSHAAPGAVDLNPRSRSSDGRLQFDIEFSLLIPRAMSATWSYELTRKGGHVVYPFTVSTPYYFTRAGRYRMTKSVETPPLAFGYDYWLSGRLTVTTPGYLSPTNFENSLMFQAKQQKFWRLDSLTAWYAGSALPEDELCPGGGGGGDGDTGGWQWNPLPDV